MERMKATAAGREAAGIGRPLFWSATAHLLGFVVLLVAGTIPAAGPFRGVVEVLLLESMGEERIAAEGTVGGSPPAGSPIPATNAPTPAVPPAASDPPSIRPRESVPVEKGASPGDTVSDLPETVPPKGKPQAEGGGGYAQGAGAVPSGGGTNLAKSTGPAMAASEPGRRGDGSGSVIGTALLRQRIQSRIVYPEEAVRRGQQGEVLLRIRIGTGGVPSEIRIARSSGVRLLDEAASSGVVRAAPLPSDPGWVEVPIRFRLR